VIGASVHDLIAAVHLWQGRWSEAQEAASKGAEIALRCRSRYLVWMGQALGACGAWMQAHDEQALEILSASTASIEQQGGGVSTSLNYGWLVEVTARLGRPQEARAHAVQLFQRGRAQDRHGMAMGYRALARLSAGTGDAWRTERYLRAADAAARFRASPRELAVNRLARAEIAAAFGADQEAAAFADGAIRAFSAMDMQWHRHYAGELLARCNSGTSTA
jgi:hypothetical protein